MAYELDLFAQDETAEPPPEHAPLAARLRPRTLEEFQGQAELLENQAILADIFRSGRLNASLLFWGPPGSGKTTLAHLVAETSGLTVHKLSAVDSGVKELRQVVEAAGRRPGAHVLFIDEIHRYNKAQQDALLPVIESGQLKLLGATTENPYFELRKALLSRCRVVRLEKLSPTATRAVLTRALESERGYGQRKISVDPAVLEQLAAYSDGDARTALNLLELAVSRGGYASDGSLTVGLSVLERLLSDQNLAYNRDGDRRYDLVSAFIKSIRGSDPDAALYWLATMLSAGEDPRFLMRRLLIAASEDVGLADPSAITVVSACARALEWVGMPEAKYHLSQATLYLATAAKSDSTKALFKAEAHVKRHGPQEVPNHLRDGHYSGARAHGIGVGYKNPHHHDGHVEQAYLPANLTREQFYEPGELGYERVIRQRLEHWGRFKG